MMNSNGYRWLVLAAVLAAWLAAPSSRRRRG